MSHRLCRIRWNDRVYEWKDKDGYYTLSEIVEEMFGEGERTEEYLEAARRFEFNIRNKRKMQRFDIKNEEGGRMDKNLWKIQIYDKKKQPDRGPATAEDIKLYGKRYGSRQQPDRRTQPQLKQLQPREEMGLRQAACIWGGGSPPRPSQDKSPDRTLQGSSSTRELRSLQQPQQRRSSWDEKRRRDELSAERWEQAGGVLGQRRKQAVGSPSRIVTEAPAVWRQPSARSRTPIRRRPGAQQRQEDRNGGSCGLAATVCPQQNTYPETML